MPKQLRSKEKIPGWSPRALEELRERKYRFYLKVLKFPEKEARQEANDMVRSVKIFYKNWGKKKVKKRVKRP